MRTWPGPAPTFTILSRHATARPHLWSLTERFAGDRLAALAQSLGAIGKPVPEILFVCVRNAGRSQMAAGWLTQLAGDLSVPDAHARDRGEADRPAESPRERSRQPPRTMRLRR